LGLNSEGHSTSPTLSKSSAAANDNVTLAPKTPLSVDAASSAGTTSSPTLTPRTELLVSTALSNGSTDNVVLTPRTLLAANDAGSGSTTSSPTLVDRYALVVGPAESLSASDHVPMQQTITPTPEDRQAVLGGDLADRTTTTAGTVANDRSGSPAGGNDGRSAGVG